MAENVSGGDGNTISAEEFSDLESDEKKKDKPRGMFGLFGGKKDSNKPMLRSLGSSSGTDGEGITGLSMRLERVSSRLDMIDDARKHTEERLSDISEKIGELRSTLIDRDKAFNESMAKFERVSDITEGLEPEKIRRDLSKKDLQIEEVKAQVESTAEKMNIILNKQKEITDILDQIKGMKDLVSIAEELDKKVKIVDGLKSDTERAAGKFENRMFELNETISGLKSTANKVNSNDETIRELLRTVDGMSLKLEQFANKEDIGKKQKEFDDKIAELRFDTESRIEKLLEAIKNLDGSGGSGHSAGGLSDKKVEFLASEVSRYGKEADGLNREIKNLKEIISKKEIVGLKELIEVGGKDAKSTIIDEIRGILREEDEKYNQRFADLELKMLELSKSVDNRIDKRIIKESKNTREAVINMVDSGSEKGRFASSPPKSTVRSAPGVSPSFRPALVSAGDLNSLVKDIYFYLDSGKYSDARSGFIKLLASYERQESSNPFILAKITDLHKRIKQIS